MRGQPPISFSISAQSLFNSGGASTSTFGRKFPPMTKLSALDYVAIVVGILLLLKVSEMAYHKRLVDAKVKDDWSKLPITRLIGRFRLLHWTLFKIPVQIIVLSILGFSITHPTISWFVGFLIIFALWFLVSRMMYDLLHAGTDRYLTSAGIPNAILVSRTRLEVRERIRSFVMSLIGFVLLIVIGYGSVYHICHLQFDRKAFTGIPPDGLEFFYFIYYSLVTFGTVGYGDIFPAGPLSVPACDSALVRIVSRALVGSEICLSFVVVAVFIASFSLAFSNDTSLSPHQNE